MSQREVDQKPKAAEAEGLEPMVMSGGAGTIGFVESIHGADAELVSFQPTKGELKMLARKYLQELFEIQRFCSSTNSTGSWEMRTEAFAWRRYCSIAEALGEPEEEFEKMIEKHKKEIAEIEAEVKQRIETEW
jgi:hypothetical protein